MKRSIWLDRLVLSTALVVLTSLGCSNDVGNDPLSPPGPEGADLPVLGMRGQVVSEPVVFPAGLPGSFTAGSLSSTGSSYVSYEPGSIPEADSIEIRNPANGSLVGARMIDGGLDPVPIPTSSGDSLEITTLGSGRILARAEVRVPEESPPRVVRTEPARRSPRVPLNIRVKVIFTEPVSAATVTSQTVRLLLNGQPVPATVSLSVDALQVELIPDQPLQPATTYVISVTTGVHDLAGDPLEQEFVSDMTTAPPALPGTIVFDRDDRDDGPRNFRIWSVRADGSGLVKLTNVFSRTPAISPDGQLIAYFLDDGTTMSLSIMNVDGTVITDVDGTVPRVMVTGGYPVLPEWSPDGSMIAFVSESDDPASWGIYVVSINWTVSSRLWPITRLTSDAGDWAPSWSPDGGRIVFGSNRNGNSDLFLMNSDGSNVTQLTNNAANDSYPGWSPDGTKIVFSSDRYRPSSNSTGDIFVMDADGSNVIRLTTQPGDHFTAAWSPSGTHVVFGSRSEIGSGLGPSAIWVMNADGSGKFQLTSPAAWQGDFVPGWGP